MTPMRAIRRGALRRKCVNCKEPWGSGPGIMIRRMERLSAGIRSISVHQHAMAPMMLFAAAEAANCDFNEAIYKGLAWISGNNELRLNLSSRLLISYGDALSRVRQTPTWTQRSVFLSCGTA